MRKIYDLCVQQDGFGVSLLLLPLILLEDAKHATNLFTMEENMLIF